MRSRWRSRELALVRGQPGLRSSEALARLRALRANREFNYNPNAGDVASSRRKGVVKCGSGLKLAPFCRSKSGGPHHGIPDSSLNAVELPFRDPLGWRHPRPATRHYVLEREIRFEVRAGDSAARIELDATEGSGKQLQVLDAAERGDRPQLEQVEARIDRGFD